MTRIQATYVIKKLPNLEKTASHEIEQGYLTDDKDSLRIRKKGSTYLITRKIESNDGISAEEIDMPIEERDFLAFWKVTKRSLKKTRYYYSDVDGVNIRIDVFHDKLEGLAVVEVIFESGDKYREFKAPSWLGKEITKEKWASNQYFAGTTYADLKRFLV